MSRNTVREHAVWRHMFLGKHWGETLETLQGASMLWGGTLYKHAHTLLGRHVSGSRCCGNTSCSVDEDVAAERSDQDSGCVKNHLLITNQRVPWLVSVCGNGQNVQFGQKINFSAINCSILTPYHTNNQPYLPSGAQAHSRRGGQKIDIADWADCLAASDSNISAKFPLSMKLAKRSCRDLIEQVQNAEWTFLRKNPKVQPCCTWRSVLHQSQR